MLTIHSLETNKNQKRVNKTKLQKIPFNLSSGKCIFHIPHLLNSRTNDWKNLHILVHHETFPECAASLKYVTLLLALSNIIWHCKTLRFLVCSADLSQLTCTDGLTLSFLVLNLVSSYPIWFNIKSLVWDVLYSLVLEMFLLNEHWKQTKQPQKNQLPKHIINSRV